MRAKIIADSLGPYRDRLTTFVVTFPRIILAELNTHRAFSRNSASSRAIPFDKMVESVKTNPFIPIAWQVDHKGMQGTEYITSQSDINSCVGTWLQARDKAIDFAKELNSKGHKGSDRQPVTKQLCNRLLEPFMWHTVIITSGEDGLQNFFNLRCPQYLFEPEDKYFRSWKDLIKYNNEMFGDDQTSDHSTLFKLQQNKGQAEIHMMALAEAMWDAYNESKPNPLKEGEWHIPFIDSIDSVQLGKLMPRIQPDSLLWHFNHLNTLRLRVAIAKCARASYTVVGENKGDDYSADIKLCGKLFESRHLSPFEHVAKCVDGEDYTSSVRCKEQGWYFNLKGFKSYRYILENEGIHS